MLYIISIIVIVLSLLGIVFLVGRRIQDLTLIDTEAIKDRSVKVKEDIIAQRMQRIIKESGQKAKDKTKDWLNFLKNRAERLQGRFLYLEKHYSQAWQSWQSKKLSKIKGGDLSSLISEAEDLLREEKWQEAEGKFISAIKINPQSKQAFKGLGILYFKQKQFEEAKEVFNFLLKLNPNDAEVFYQLGQIALSSGDFEEAKKFFLKSLALEGVPGPIRAGSLMGLGLVYKFLGDPPKAIEQFKEAVRLEPNNPRYLDYLIELSIIVGDKELAQRTLKKLREVNPENQKLEEFRKKIKEMPMPGAHVAQLAEQLHGKE